MKAYKTVAEVVQSLEDTSFVKELEKKVAKGGKGTFTYIPWNETARLMNRVFGHFGWDAIPVSSANDFERGIYRTDLMVVGRAIDEDGLIVEFKRPGTGACQVNPLSHEDAIKSSRSDALSTGAKMIGDAFGLYLYDKADPAYQTAPTQNNTQRTDTRQENKPKGNSNGEGKATEKQIATLKKNGCPDSELVNLSFGDASAMIDKVAKNGWKWDASFGGSPTPVQKAAAKLATKPAVAEEPDDLDDFFNN